MVARAPELIALAWCLGCTAEPTVTTATAVPSTKNATAAPSVAEPPPDEPATTTKPTEDTPTTPVAAPPKPIGCWEREFGSPPDPAAIGPSLPEPPQDCEGCERLRVGPKAIGLHTEVLERLVKIADALPAPPIDEPVLWVNSGAREGDLDDSMHNQALAIDAVICGLDTRQTAQKLRDAGFTCVIEYFDGAGNPCHFAHADLRATRFATGAYAKGGRKARTCPKRATSRSMSCDNSAKRDWTYSEG